jgi:hypothetical protein
MTHQTGVSLGLFTITRRPAAFLSGCASIPLHKMRKHFLIMTAAALLGVDRFLKVVKATLPEVASDRCN